MTQILDKFYNNHKDLYDTMKACEHGYMGEEINPFHLEGSILTHTMMVMKEAEYASEVMKLTALCHDFGKPFVFTDIHDTKRRRFSNHEGVSAFFAKGVLEESFPHLDLNDRNRILFTVANHGSFYHLFKSGDIPQENYTKFLDRYSLQELEDLFEFYKYDHSGRFAESKGDKDNMTNLHRSFNKILKMARSKSVAFETQVIPSKTLTILIGPPRVGKTQNINNLRKDIEIYVAKEFINGQKNDTRNTD